MKRGSSQTLHRIGETEARSSTGWPGSPSTRPLRPQGRPPPGQPSPPTSPTLAARTGRVQNKRRGGGAGRAGAGRRL